ncbi:MAG: hypothetical protein O7H39_11570 [Gammaproteobacteria bacterium]|nr:hypothetical protein [Gammaproteobacteria bacterium]
MGEIGTWDPDSGSELNPEMMALLDVATRALDDDRFGLDDTGISIVKDAMLLQPSVWRDKTADLAADRLIQWIKLFTLAEGRVNVGDVGSKSPVIPLVAVLKRRDEYPRDLTKWIKANSDNKFLPYGSLLDRLG